MKKISFLILFCLVFASSPFLLRTLGDKSIAAKLAIQIPYCAEWAVNVDPLKGREVDEILRQKFSYLAQGYQSVAFVSDDQRYVLKVFFKGESLHPWRRLIRTYVLHLRKKIYGMDRVYQELTGAKIAYSSAPDLTGLIFAHLNQTKSVYRPLNCTDSFGRKIHVPLDDCRFVIQLKGIPFEEVFATAIAQNDQAKFERLTRSFISLLQSRIARGIRNSDVAVEKNFGFIGEKALEWDFGQYEKAQTPWTAEMRALELASFLSKGERFFQKNHPSWVPLYKEIVLKSSIFDSL